MSSSVFLALALGTALAGRANRVPPPDPPVVQRDRVEIAVDHRDRWSVEAAGSDGLVLLGTDHRSGSWTLVGYDTRFQQKWVTTWEVPSRKEQVVDRSMADGAMTLLVHRPRSRDFRLVSVQLDDGSLTERTIEAPARLRSAGSLHMVDDDAYVLALSRRTDQALGKEGTLVWVDAAGQAAFVPVADAVDRKWVSFHRIRRDVEAGALELSLGSYQQGERQVHALTVRDGRVDAQHTLHSPEDASHTLLNTQRVKTDSAELLVGTWATGQSTHGAQGLYVSKLADDGSEAWRRTISFTDLDAFFDYLPKRKQARVERRAERRKQRGSDLRLHYLLNLHDVVQLEDRFLVVGEAFYPEYETRTRTVTYTQNGVTRTRVETYTVFVGYRYTHALVVALDADGQRLWDASFEIGNILSHDIRDRVQVNADGDRVTMVYAWGGGIFSKVATSEGVVREKQGQAAQAIGGGRVKRTRATHTEHWYDDHFLVWSYDKVVGGEGGRRKVFAFSTLSGRPSEAPAESSTAE